MGKGKLCVLVAGVVLGLAVPCLGAAGPMLVAGCNPMQHPPGLYVADADGNDMVRLLWSAPPGEWNCLAEPDWSPDGTSVVLTYNCQLAVMDLAAMLDFPWEPTPTVIHECGWAPSWSPTGDRIAFQKMSDISLINPDGSGWRNVTGPLQYEPEAVCLEWEALSWTPDGMGLVCQAHCPEGAGVNDLYHLTDLEGPGVPTVVQLIATPDVSEESPAVSPDGSELAYSAGAPWADPLPAAGVCVADFPGLTTVRVLTDDPGYRDRVCAWTPDGEYVYFLRCTTGDHPRTWQLCRVKADGSEPEEAVPGVADWGWQALGGVSFLKRGVYGTSSYALPGYTGVPFSVGVVGVENLAGLQTTLRFKDCCNIFDTMDSCTAGSMISHWAMVGPTIDQAAGTVKTIAYAPNPGLDQVAGTGELLHLTASMTMYEDLSWDQGACAVWFDPLKLSDDWGDPIEMPVVVGGMSLKPFSYLEVSGVPVYVEADEVDPVPFGVTITARGDMDELLPWVDNEVELFVEMPEEDYGYPTVYSDIITPTSTALVEGSWTGEVAITGSVREPARILARYQDWGGRSSEFSTLTKGDINADGVIDIFDVVKTANMAIGRGTWADWQWWAADMNRDEEVNIFDVVLCAGAAASALSVTGETTGFASQGPDAAEPVWVTSTVTSTKLQTMLEVDLSDCAGLAGIQVALVYDASRLRYAGASAGPLLRGGGDWAVLDNDLGGVVRAIAFTPTLRALSGGSGGILSFTFDQVGRGNGKAGLTSVQLSAPGGVEIPCEMGRGKGKAKGGGKDK
jgi:hypothetical protein